MNQADIEKYAFLYFCGEKDRDILLENRKMTFEDLERFSYLTDLFGFQKYRAQIWNKFSGQFEEKFEALEHLYEESADIVRDNYTIQEKRRFEKYIKSAVCHNFKLWQTAFLKKSFFHCVCWSVSSKSS